MNQFTGLYEIRDMNKQDENFVLATFLRGVYYGNSWFTEIPKDIFMLNYKRVAEELIQNNKAVVKIACLPDDPSVIIGYSILSHDFQTIIWTYVKKNWRGKGIGRSLVPIAPTQVMHLTPVGKSLLSKFESKPIFNPFFNP